MQIIERGMATPELMAHVAVSKFDDHLPLNRQEKIFARQGIDLPRTTLLGWLFKTAQDLGALVELMTSRQCNADFLGVDETPVPLQAPGKTHKARTSGRWSEARTLPTRFITLNEAEAAPVPAGS